MRATHLSVNVSCTDLWAERALVARESLQANRCSDSWKSGLCYPKLEVRGCE